ncbi:MAG: hypothetical protein HIU92_00255 [Proteobacteria bacterium]|nr:hypothetical protein [Pseudomonadota bacterium]
MFRPYYMSAAVLALLVASAPLALAQQEAEPAATLQSTMTFRAQPAALAAPSDAILTALSAEAGIPYLPKRTEAMAPTTVSATATDGTDESRLCVRAGLGLSVPVMAGSTMTVEHGLIGCPTHTGGLPIVVLQDPVLQPPPASRTGDYNIDLTLRYRVLQLKHIQIVATASEQGVGYSLDSPVSGNNLMLAMSLIF